jgi:hypothetical protein
VIRAEQDGAEAQGRVEFVVPVAPRFSPVLASPVVVPPPPVPLPLMTMSFWSRTTLTPLTPRRP